jgi:hypothetical protein
MHQVLTKARVNSYSQRSLTRRNIKNDFDTT